MAEEAQWYIVVDNKPDGPYTERDLDVKYRTNELTSGQFVWRQGMSEWKPLYMIDELK